MNNYQINKGPVITIDGPSGTGKGTIAHMLANRLGWHFLDSGAIYRLLALAVIYHRVSEEDDIKIVNLAKNLRVYFKLSSEDSTMRYFLEEQDVTDAIRSETCGNTASKISKYPLVREALLSRQRNFRILPGLVTDGRDMGTIVFPDAQLKIFLDASLPERARRRYNQLIKKGIDVSLAHILADIKERDERDRNRACSPLKPAENALILDTTHLSVQEVFQWVIKKIKTENLLGRLKLD